MASTREKSHTTQPSTGKLEYYGQHGPHVSAEKNDSKAKQGAGRRERHSEQHAAKQEVRTKNRANIRST